VGIRVLGPTDIDGAGVLAGRDRKVLAALVVMDGRACPADRIAAALYGDEPPPIWRKVVQGAVMRSTRALGDLDQPGGHVWTAPRAWDGWGRMIRCPGRTCSTAGARESLAKSCSRPAVDMATVFDSRCRRDCDVAISGIAMSTFLATSRAARTPSRDGVSAGHTGGP